MNSNRALNIFELLFFIFNVMIGFAIAIPIVKFTLMPKWMIIPIGITITAILIYLIIKLENKATERNEHKWILKWIGSECLTDDDLRDRLQTVQSEKAKIVIKDELLRRNGKSA